MQYLIRLYCLILAACLLPAQTATVSVSRQPLEAFYAVYGRKLQGVALYSATACSSAAVTLPMGRVAQASIIEGIGVVDRALIESIGVRAHKKSRKYIAAEMIKWGAFLGATLTAGGVVSASQGIAVAFPMLAQVSDRLSGQWAQESTVPPSVAGRWLDPGTALQIPAGGCASLLYLGDYRRDKSQFSVSLEVRP